METDCYKLLGISPQADDKTIRKAWRIKTKEVHPDVNPSPDAEKKFRGLSDAMETLLDDAKRIKHDHHFGYAGNMKNKYSNAKQSFSEYQQEKAKVTVNEWTNDYNVAMAMREEQRRKVVKRHKRNVMMIMIGLVCMLAISIVLWIVFG
ncbi:MAG: J domain-containing protein [Bacteroidota bacterium]|nr:J domain-containing protein [Bacteroidota bacterium]